MNSTFLLSRSSDRPDKVTNSLASHHERSLHIPQPYGQHSMPPKSRDIHKGFIAINHHVKAAQGFMENGNTSFQALLGVKEEGLGLEAR